LSLGRHGRPAARRTTAERRPRGRAPDNARRLDQPGSHRQPDRQRRPPDPSPADRQSVGRSAAGGSRRGSGPATDAPGRHSAAASAAAPAAPAATAAAATTAAAAAAAAAAATAAAATAATAASAAAAAATAATAAADLDGTGPEYADTRHLARSGSVRANRDTDDDAATPARGHPHEHHRRGLLEIEHLRQEGIVGDGHW
jgi:hypothetical protein